MKLTFSKRTLGVRKSILLAILAYSCAAFQSSEPATPSEACIVHLREPSVIESAARTYGARPGGASLLQRAPLALLEDAIADRQNRTAERLQRAGARVLDRRSFLLNVLLVEAPNGVLESLQEDEEILAVYPNEKRFLQADRAAGLVGAPAAWADIGESISGQGVKIGIIDSGIDRTHPMFNATGMTYPGQPGQYPKGLAYFTSPKIIVARSFVANFTTNAADQTGHGTSVAALAAGRKVTAPLGVIQGIAPAAYLGNYKVFGESGETSIFTVLSALDAAVQDGMDVVNMSLGGTPGPTDALEWAAVKAATEAGVIVVTGAGNSGPEMTTVTAPGIFPEAITVGATANDRLYQSGGGWVTLASSPQFSGYPKSVAYLPRHLQNITAAIEPPRVLARAIRSGTIDDDEACSEQLPNLGGSIALVRRGTCLFRTKLENVTRAGAVGMIVYNNVEPGLALMDLRVGSEDDLPAPLKNVPAIMIDKAAGENLVGLIKKSFRITASIQAQSNLWVPLSNPPDQITTFSGRGPVSNFTIKPDLLAPGQGIYTGTKGDQQYAINLSGTSFATPIVSGAAALLKQKRGNWTPKQIKSALVNTADRRALLGDGGAPIMHGGNGILDLASAVKVTTVLDPVSVCFGAVESSVLNSSPVQTRNLEITNLGSRERRYLFQVLLTAASQAIDVGVTPGEVTLAPGQRQTVTLSARYPSSPTTGVFEGYVRVTEPDTNMQLTTGFWGGVMAPEKRKILRVSKSGAGYSTLYSALQAANPADIIEIADDRFYDESLRIRINDSGLPLNGLILRAAPGRTPVINGTGFTTTMTVSDVKDVNIENLEIRGRGTNLHFINASGTVKNSIIGGSQETEIERGIVLDLSRVHLFNNQIQYAKGLGISAFSSSLLIHNSAIRANRGGGLSVQGSSWAALFDSRIDENSGAPGVDVEDSGVLLKNVEMLKMTGYGLRAKGWKADVTLADSWLAHNQQTAIHLQNSAQAHVFRSVLHGNKEGLVLLTGASAVVSNTRLTSNAGGIRLSSGSLRITDSLIAGSTTGDGVLFNGGSLDLYNSTLYGNRGFGAKLAATGASVANSILWQNQASEDLQTVDGNQVVTNLIGRSKLAGGNDNRADDPLFRAPSASDFSLTEKSPAIDRGNHLFPVSTADLLHRNRTANGRVDLGAIEYASQGIVAGRLPVLSTEQGCFVGLAVASTYAPAGLHDPEQVAVTLKAHKVSGEQYGVHSFEIPPGGQHSLLLNEAFSGLEPGWVEILTSRPGATSFTLLGDYALNRMDGAQLSASLSSRLLFPEAICNSERETWLYLINPHTRDTEVTIGWSGNSSVSRRIPARGMIHSTVKTLFGPVGAGFIRVESEPTLPIFGMQIFGNQDSRAGLLALSESTAAPILYASQMATGESVDTVLNLINLGERTEVTIQAFEEAGNLLGTVSQQMSPRSQLRRSVREILKLTSDVVGFLKVSSQSGSLLGNITFGNTSGRFMTALPLQARGAREFVFSHVGHGDGVFTGVTLLNAQKEPAMITLQVFDLNGNEKGLRLMELPAGTKQARLLHELVPGLQEQMGGFVRVRSSTPVIGFEVFGKYDLDFMSAVPQQVIVE
jgi:minor extracellular serine protease Vpr